MRCWVIIPKEIRCTQCRLENKQNTCRRRAGGNLHLKAIHRVGILTVVNGEDTMQ